MWYILDMGYMYGFFPEQLKAHNVLNDFEVCCKQKLMEAACILTI